MNYQNYIKKAVARTAAINEVGVEFEISNEDFIEMAKAWAAQKDLRVVPRKVTGMTASGEITPEEFAQHLKEYMRQNGL